jgi:Holliday junction resolvase RusA-like endonuclease
MKPISVNASHRIVKFGKRASRIKTEKAVQFEQEFGYHLVQYNELKAHILDVYDPRMFSILVEAYFYMNEQDFFTKPKKGFKTVSQKSMDLDNMLKVSFDQIFRWMEIDDSQVTKIIAEKIPTNSEPTMVFRISLVKFPELFVVQTESI